MLLFRKLVDLRTTFLKKKFYSSYTDIHLLTKIRIRINPTCLKQVRIYIARNRQNAPKPLNVQSKVSLAPLI